MGRHTPRGRILCTRLGRWVYVGIVGVGSCRLRPAEARRLLADLAELVAQAEAETDGDGV